MMLRDAGLDERVQAVELWRSIVESLSCYSRGNTDETSAHINLTASTVRDSRAASTALPRG